MSQIYIPASSQSGVVDSIEGTSPILVNGVAGTPQTGNAIVSLLDGASGTLLQGKGLSTPSAYTTATYPATTTANQLLYSSATNTVGGLTTADNGVLITGTTGIPSILVNGTTGQVLTATTGSPPSWQAGGGGGGVTGPVSSTENAIATWANTTGTALLSPPTPLVSSGGVVTNSNQPAFLVNLSTLRSAVTGDGTVYQILYDTIVFDQGSNITLNSGGKTIFTAPVTGKYQFNINIMLDSVSAAQTEFMAILVTTAADYFFGYQNPGATNVVANSGYLAIPYSVLIPMSQNDTAYIEIDVSGSSKVVDVYGPGNFNLFSGFLVC